MKIGGAPYRKFVHGDDILEMECTDLLVALAGSTFFSSALKDVVLNACAVFVSLFPEENANATELLLDNTIGTLAGSASRVYIRVDLPVAGGGGECRRAGHGEGVR